MVPTEAADARLTAGGCARKQTTLMCKERTRLVGVELERCARVLRRSGSVCSNGRYCSVGLGRGELGEAREQREGELKQGLL